jgi:eukaryotic-like serine/threonine-protein kinase
MILSSGTRLGPYEIQSLLGAGGMGEVYRARDTRLDRIVAIKVLTQQLADEALHRERFEREARAVAALSHPHICALYDVGEATDPQPSRQSALPTLFLVMEYLEGETLAARLERGALPIAQAITDAASIADALDKAHRRGVVHRDLKPGNVMLTRTGIKLLDFGLARLNRQSPSQAASRVSALPTAAGDLTAQGTILGTFQYMAPEQLEGGDADARTDIFALGAVLYEMVTGRRAFEGKSQAGLIGAILEREPPAISAQQPMSPPALDAIVRRCLAKDPADRWQSAGDLGAALSALRDPERGAAVSPLASRLDPSRLTSRSRRFWIGMAALLGVTTIALLAILIARRESPAILDAMRFSIAPPGSGIFQTPLLSGSAAPVGGTISPDGRTLAFTATNASGKVLLWVRPLDSLDARSLAGTEDAALPFWSPDSQSIGFFAPGKLKRVDINGGSLQVLCDVARGRGGSWNRDGVIIFAAGLATGLSRIAATGGEPQPITALRNGQLSHRFPYFLPDGRRYLYYGEGARADDTGIFAAALNDDSHQRLATADSAAVYASTGHLLFVRQGTLFAQPFDAVRLSTSGDPVPLAESVPSEGTAAAFSVSDTGVLTYRSGLADDQFGWYDRTGKLLGTIGPPGHYRGVELSPDGNRIAVHRHDGNGGDIWAVESSGALTRLTFDASQDNSSPTWSPDGRQIAFGSRRNGKWGLYRKRADGSTEDELLAESDAPRAPSDWSPDGKYLVYWLIGTPDQWSLPLGTTHAQPIPVTGSRFVVNHAQLSPNGRWIAYASNQNGALQIYVRPFPSGEGVWLVSAGAGVMPRWSPTGRELFYLTSYDAGMLMSVSVQTNRNTFVASMPRELFGAGMITPPHSTAINVYHTYAVSPDGQRFLIPRSTSTLRSSEAAPTPITLVLNWTTLLRR